MTALAGAWERSMASARVVAIAFLVLLGVLGAAAYHVGPYVVSGLSDGAIYALAALGLVLTYKTSGIFNFAIGAQAAASAYVFYSLRVTESLPWPVAALLSMVIVGLLGSLLLERLGYWLSEAPPVMRVVATLGMLVLLQAGLTAGYGSATIQFRAFLPSRGLKLLGVPVQGSQLITVALALVATAALYAFFQRARLGVAMRAVVESPTLLALEGTSPVTVRRYAWAIGSCFVSISGMLLAPTLGIDVNLMLLVYIAAFGAAAVGGFSSLPLTLGSAMAIGVVMNVMYAKLAGQSNTIVAELYTQVPFLVLLAALVFLPRAKLQDEATNMRRRLRPPARLAPGLSAAGLAAGVTVLLVVPLVVGRAFIDQYTTGLGFAIVIGSLGLLLWTSGQLSLCQMAFAAVGATTFAHATGAGIPWLAALLLAAGVAGIVGAIAAIPSFRLSGVYLAVATFGFGLLFQNLVFRSFLMFGVTDSRPVARPHVSFLAISGDRGYYYLVLGLAAVCAGVIIGVRRSRLGRLLRGLSDSPAALEAHGANTRLTRLYVFALSAAIAAIGGILIAGVTRSAGGDPSGPFGYFNSLVLLTVLAFCGRRPLASPVVAALVFEVLKIYRPFSNSTFVKYEGVIFGALAIFVAVAPAVKIVSRRATDRREQGSSHRRSVIHEVAPA